MGKATIDKTAIIDKGSQIGEGTKIWAFVQVGKNAIVGKNCILGNGSFVDRESKIGNNVKLMNKAQVFRGCEVGNNVFIGPGVVLANDKNPKPDAERKFKGYEWKIGNNVSIGANSVILPDVNIEEFAVVGAGSIVTKDVPKHGIVYGNPTKLHGFVCKCGKRMVLKQEERENAMLECKKCGETLSMPLKTFRQAVE